MAANNVSTRLVCASRDPQLFLVEEDISLAKDISFLCYCQQNSSLLYNPKINRFSKFVVSKGMFKTKFHQIVCVNFFAYPYQRYVCVMGKTTKARCGGLKFMDPNE